MAGDLVDLKGRNALVTGAGQGIGRQIALHLAAHNAGTVVVNDYYLGRAEAVAAEVRALGARAAPLEGDVTDFAAIHAMVARLEADGTGIDILVNNAGNAGPTHELGELPPFWETGEADWRDWLGTNLNGVLNVSHAVLPGMRARGYGRIVTVISDAGRVGEPAYVVYSAAKAGAAGFMRALAKAAGPDGINCNCISLAAIRTPGLERRLADPEKRRRMLRLYPTRRLGEPEDAANMVLFLASDAASWITGQTIPVNGGYSFAV